MPVTNAMEQLSVRAQTASGAESLQITVKEKYTARFLKWTRTAEKQDSGCKGDKMNHKYGMRLRGFSIGCQPSKGFVDAMPDDTGKYWDILFYSRKLTDQELADYELDYLGEEEPT